MFSFINEFSWEYGKSYGMFQISELFQVVYSSATAVHMFSGKAYASALQALVQSVLEPIALLFMSSLSPIEQLSTCDVDRKYLCYASNSNDEQLVP